MELLLEIFKFKKWRKKADWDFHRIFAFALFGS